MTRTVAEKALNTAPLDPQLKEEFTTEITEATEVSLCVLGALCGEFFFARPESEATSMAE